MPKTPHIILEDNEISEYVLMPGDPVRAKVMAEALLNDVKVSNGIRGMFYYTGFYKGTRITFAPSGMGCPSIGIYAYEMYKFFGVKCIIRVGTCLSLTDEFKIGDVVIAESAINHGVFSDLMLGYHIDEIDFSPQILNNLKKAMEKEEGKVRVTTTFSSDVFYLKNMVKGHDEELGSGCKIHEMEAFGLMCCAEVCGQKAGALLTVADHVNANKHAKNLTPTERSHKALKMFTIGCEAIVDLVKQNS